MRDAEWSARANGSSDHATAEKSRGHNARHAACGFARITLTGTGTKGLAVRDGVMKRTRKEQYAPHTIWSPALSKARLGIDINGGSYHHGEKQQNLCRIRENPGWSPTRRGLTRRSSATNSIIFTFINRFETWRVAVTGRRAVVGLARRIASAYEVTRRKTG